jgi:hypothetical protein
MDAAILKTRFPRIGARPILRAGVGGARNVVLYWYLGIAIAGILIGLRFRAGALVAATLVTVVAASVLQTRDHYFDQSSLRVVLQSVVLLQVGYLAGLALAAFWRRVRR